MWHDVILQLLVKGRNGDMGPRVGDRQVYATRGAGSDLPFCGIFELVAFSKSSGAGIPRADGADNNAVGARAAAGVSLANSLAGRPVRCVTKCYERLANPLERYM